MAAAVLSLLLVNTRVRGDGNGYFAWIASAVVDHDLDFRNQYRHGNTLFTERFFDTDDVVLPERVTSTGYIENQWSIGPALLWAPWFVAAHAVVTTRGLDPQDGYAPIYRRACAIGSMCYALAAIWLGVLVARHLGISTSVAWSAAVVVWGGTSLIVYAHLLPFHVHAMAAFTVSLFLWYGLTRADGMTGLRWAVWGALAALMGLTYYLDAVFMLVAVPVAIAPWRHARSSWGCLWFGVTAAIVSLPHWWSRAIIYGSSLTTGYQDQFFWLTPRLWATAFSSNHGVILWTPLIAIGVVGVVSLARRRVEWRGVVTASVVFYVVVASYENWHGLSSFGNRFFVSWTLPMVVGVAAIVDACWSRGGVARSMMIAVLTGVVVWNAGLAFQWASKMLPNRGSVDMWIVVSQQVAVPRRAVTMGWRYLTDRDRLAAEIEEQDQREWDRYQKIR